MGPLALMLLSAGLSGIGGAIKANAAKQNAQAVVNARNQVLRDTMALNKPLAESSRAMFTDRINTGAPDEAAQAAATAPRQALMDAAITMPDVDLVSENAPTVVKSEIARAMERAMESGREEAASSARLGGYGDLWFNQGVQNNALASELGTNTNFAGGNLALLPHLQDLAEVGTPQRSGLLGDVLSGVGNAMGSFAGTQPVGPGGFFNPGVIPRFTGRNRGTSFGDRFDLGGAP